METSDADSRPLSDKGVIGTFEALVGEPASSGSELPLSVGGGGNNVATGRINCGQAAGLRGGLLSSKGTVRGKPLICQP